MLSVEEQDEQPRAHVLRGVAHLGDRRRLAPTFLRSHAANAHMLEAIDLLKFAFVEDFDLVLAQIRHRFAVGGRIHVDADVIDFSTERLQLGGRRWFLCDEYYSQEKG